MVVIAPPSDGVASNCVPQLQNTTYRYRAPLSPGAVLLQFKAPLPAYPGG